jgi:transcriptional regulator with XRE-family HTH domain
VTERHAKMSRPVDVYVGARIQLRRTALRMSQGKLAAALGVSSQQVRKYERGVTRVGPSRLYQLSQVLGVPISFFFEEGEDNDRIPTEAEQARYLVTELILAA